MLPNPKNHAIYPSVVPVGISTETVILATERAFFPRDGAEYTLTVIQVNEDESNYYFPSHHTVLPLVAKDGVLRFDLVFPAEGEYTLLLEREGKPAESLTVYALEQDLYELRPLKGDLHAHSFRSDGKRDPSALAGHFREQGYEFFALTDHNRFYPGDEIDEIYRGVRLGITRVPGEEVHTPGSELHIVRFGGEGSVASQYIKDADGYEASVAEHLKNVPASVPEQYRLRYARAAWASDRIRACGGLAVFAHPFWRTRAKMYNVKEDFARILLTSGLFDAYELIGGMGQPGNNLSLALWSELRVSGLRIPTVSSSDVHSLTGPTFRQNFTLCFARANTAKDVCDAIRQGLCVAVEACGEHTSRQYRCYGDLRLVSYAQFLLRYYYPELQRICQGEGIAMRNYAMGDADASLIEALVAQSERYVMRFFGKLPPCLPSSDQLALEEKHRAIHLEIGPSTLGSHIDGPPTLQI